MGAVMNGNRHGDGRATNRNDASFSSDLQSASFSGGRSMTANELGPVSQRPSRPAHTRAATYRRKQSMEAQLSDSQSSLADPPTHPSSTERFRQPKAQPGTKPSRPHTAVKDDSDSQSSISQLSARRQRAHRARGAPQTKPETKEKEKDKEEENGKEREREKERRDPSPALSKHTKKKSSKRHHRSKKAPEVATPPDDPSHSLESSQVLQPPLESEGEATAPPAPTNRMRSSRLSRAQSEADLTAAAASTPATKEKATTPPPPPAAPAPATEPAAAPAAAEAAAAAPKAAPTPEKPAKEEVAAPAKKKEEKEGGTTKPKARTSTTAISPPQPPPFKPRPSASPTPAPAHSLNSFSSTIPLFNEAAGSHVFSDQGVVQQPSVSGEVTVGDQPSFEYENGYGMFFIDAGENDRCSSTGSETTVPAPDGSGQRRISSSPPTTPKAGKGLSRRNRRASFVSFGGEIRLA